MQLIVFLGQAPLSLSLAYVFISFSDVCFLLFPLWLTILFVPILRKCDLIEPLDIPGWPPYLQSCRTYRVTLFINYRAGPWESLREFPDQPIKINSFIQNEWLLFFIYQICHKLYKLYHLFKIFKNVLTYIKEIYITLWLHHILQRKTFSVLFCFEFFWWYFFEDEQFSFSFRSGRCVVNASPLGN